MKRNYIKGIKRISSYQYDNIFNTHIDESGLYYYNMYNSIKLPENFSKATYDIHTFREGDYWTKLASKYYGNKKLWWVILVANNIINPLKLPETGTELKILKPEAVSLILNEVLNDNSK
jgi:hypothetical protein